MKHLLFHETLHYLPQILKEDNLRMERTVESLRWVAEHLPFILESTLSVPSWTLGRDSGQQPSDRRYIPLYQSRYNFSHWKTLILRKKNLFLSGNNIYVSIFFLCEHWDSSIGWSHTTTRPFRNDILFSVERTEWLSPNASAKWHSFIHSRVWDEPKVNKRILFINYGG